MNDADILWHSQNVGQLEIERNVIRSLVWGVGLGPLSHLYRALSVLQIDG